MTHLDDIHEVDENLFIGSFRPRLNFKKIRKAGITAIVNLMEDRLYTPPRKEFKYLHKGFPDETYPPHDYIKEILDFIENNIKDGKVLVHCSMGISRSGAICTAWVLKKHPNWSWKEADKHISKNHMIYPAVEIREAILDYLESIEGYRREI